MRDDGQGIKVGTSTPMQYKVATDFINTIMDENKYFPDNVKVGNIKENKLDLSETKEGGINVPEGSAPIVPNMEKPPKTVRSKSKEAKTQESQSPTAAESKGETEKSIDNT